MECVTDIVIATVPRGENAQTVFTGFTQMQSGTPSQPAGQPAAEETAVDLSYFIWKRLLLLLIIVNEKGPRLSCYAAQSSQCLSWYCISNPYLVIIYCYLWTQGIVEMFTNLSTVFSREVTDLYKIISKFPCGVTDLFRWSITFLVKAPICYNDQIYTFPVKSLHYYDELFLPVKSLFPVADLWEWSVTFHVTVIVAVQWLHMNNHSFCKGSQWPDLLSRCFSLNHHKVIVSLRQFSIRWDPFLLMSAIWRGCGASNASGCKNQQVLHFKRGQDRNGNISLYYDNLTTKSMIKHVQIFCSSR